MTRISRRRFLKKAAMTGAALSFPTIIPANVLGRNGIVPPSERVNVGVISCGDRSGISIDYKNYAKSQVVAVCDPVCSSVLVFYTLFAFLAGKEKVV